MPAFRQVGEKQLPNPVLCMAWSPKRDLIALANTTGELLLHRLASFQRVWCLPPSEYTGKEITALAWRPDGKILAFSLGDTKQVVLCGVEKAEILHVFPMQNLVTCMHWTEVIEENSALSSFYNSEDESKLFLPKLPTLPKSYSTTSKIFSEEKSDEIMNLLGEVRLNILVLGGDAGFVELYAYGMYKIATVTGVSGTCRSLSMSSDLKSLSVIAEVRSADNNPEICYIQLDTGLLSDCLPEVTRMARKFTHISTLLQYLHLSLNCMCEAWEDILMQMDLRLTKFVQEKNTSTQGLKKLGQSIESSYSSIQKLVISHLQSGSEALLYHLSEVKGMSLWKQRFEALGLDSGAIEGAITAVGSFSLKMTQKDIAFVADFLSEHFSENEELFDRKGKYFNVERVGQYLKDEDEDLVSPPNTKGNQWLRFLQESTHLKESPLLFPSYPQKSLHFVKRMMENAIDQCLQKPALLMIFIFRSHYIYSCLDARFYDDDMLTVVLQGAEDSSRRVLAQLPLTSTLSCETEFNWDTHISCIVRLDQQSGAIPCQGLVLGNQWRELENMKAQFVAVNGIRKVACVLSDNLRHIRVFEMDVEDEDDEGADSQNASADQDGLETTMSSQGQGEDSVDAEGKAGEQGEEGFQKAVEHLESDEALNFPKTDTRKHAT
uniref:Anaphase-promoting complex subunit 4 n=1 Tax=Anabas testudineus TaxID=64144 RepID=A0A7N6B2Z6_ANATE